jgi:hypothetical protein
MDRKTELAHLAIAEKAVANGPLTSPLSPPCGKLEQDAFASRLFSFIRHLRKLIPSAAFAPDCVRAKSISGAAPCMINGLAAVPTNSFKVTGFPDLMLINFE